MEVEDKPNILIPFAGLIKASNSHLDDGQKLLNEILVEPFMVKDAFLDKVYKTKQHLDLGMRELNRTLYTLEKSTPEYKQLSDFYKVQNAKYSKIKLELLLLINNQNYKIKTIPKLKDNGTTLKSLLAQLKHKENDFYINFESKETGKFIELSKAYYELSEYLYVSLLGYFDDRVDENHRNKRYLKLIDAIELDSHCLEQFDDHLDSKMRSALVDISESLKAILEDYYQDENHTTCLEIITKKLKACTRKGKLEGYSIKLDEQMLDLTQSEFKVSKVMSEIGKLFGGKAEKKASIKLFLEIFKDFNRILIELELDKPNKVIHLSDYYQYAYFFVFFKICIKIFLILSLQACQKRIANFNIDEFLS